MINSQTSKKQGFTIIEIVLVLAVAGLIFLMIFMAIPALQRAQRDNGRKRSVGLVIAAINSWKANNKGRSVASAIKPSEITLGDLSGNLDEETGQPLKWAKAIDAGLLDNYLTLSDKRNDDGKSSLSSEIKEVRIVVTTKATYVYHGESNGASIANKQQRITIYVNAVCPEPKDTRRRGEKVYSTFKKTDGGGSAAVVSFLENGGLYCENA